MRILIKNATIVFPGHKLNGKRRDILVDKGKILDISTNISDEKAKIIKEKALCVSPGWIDIGTIGGEPGYEYRENFDSLSRAAASGGYTGLALFPNASPCIDNKSSIQYIVNNTASGPVAYYPIGAISKGCRGEEITEMMDMQRNGAVAFSDGNLSVSSNGLLLRALQYIKSFNGLVIHHPDDPSLSYNNDIHEGLVSTSLGLKGSPSMAEVLTLERDLQIAEYAESRLLVHNISTAESVRRIKKRKSDSLYSSVSYLNLCLNDESLSTFDPHFKANPPLRSEKDRKGLVKGIRNGVIDIITSNHVPLEEELKKKEFVYAAPGAIGLQTVYSSLRAFAPGISAEQIVTCLAINTRKVLGLSVPEFENGSSAELSLFSENSSWTMNESNNQSLSKNSPFMGHEFSTKVVGIINGSKSFINKY